MSYFIEFEDLVSNAFIEALERGNKRFFSHEELMKYGTQIINILNKNGIEGTLTFSREHADKFYDECSDCFEVTEFGIKIKPEINSAQLRKRFRINLALDLLRAFVDESSIKVLGV